jgi:allophanate hydrolase
MLPTAPCTYTVAEMRAEPVRLNSNLGRYTNFTNLLGLAAIAVPAGFKRDGLPGGVTLIGPAWSDDALAPLADALHRASACGMGIDTTAAIPAVEWAPPATAPVLEIAVVGAHLDGLPLNHELRGLGGTLVRTARTAGDYKLYALPDTVPAKPGLVRVTGYTGAGIEVEIWGLAPEAFARFSEAIPAPLGIGKITLDDGGTVSGFLCEAHAIEGAQDISAHGGWRGFLAAS